MASAPSRDIVARERSDAVVPESLSHEGPDEAAPKRSRRGPVDPRLWRYARSARPHLVIAVALALVITATIVVIAIVLGRVLAGVITDPGKREFGAWTTELVILAVAVAVRGLASWWQARLAHRAGSAVVAELETAVLRAGAELPPRELDLRRTEIAVVVGSGLRGWFTGYLPALLLACLVPPVVLVVIALHDRTSALIAVITVPLIPVFMVLIGLLTQGRAEATLAATTRLSDQILDLFAGMPTLRALGREGAGGPSMTNQVQVLGDSLRQRTMRALRIAFLSSMVLESLATLSVALIAVAIGLRLVFGEMALYSGLVALILAPEVYWPLRQVGEKFRGVPCGAGRNGGRRQSFRGTRTAQAGRVRVASRRLGRGRRFGCPVGARWVRPARCACGARRGAARWRGRYRAGAGDGRRRPRDGCACRYGTGANHPARIVGCRQDGHRARPAVSRARTRPGDRLDRTERVREIDYGAGDSGAGPT